MQAQRAPCFFLEVRERYNFFFNTQKFLEETFQTFFQKFFNFPKYG
jgi:hypothetical protein